MDCPTLLHETDINLIATLSISKVRVLLRGPGDFCWVAITIQLRPCGSLQKPNRHCSLAHHGGPGAQTSQEGEGEEEAARGFVNQLNCNTYPRCANLEFCRPQPQGLRIRQTWEARESCGKIA